MADDNEASPKPDLDAIINSLDIPVTARMADKRVKDHSVPRYQALSTGQWYRPRDERGIQTDDFSGDELETLPAEIGEPTGPVPLAHEMEAARIAKQMDAMMKPMTEAAIVEAAMLPHRRMVMPERFKLRRNIDMTIHYPPKPKNDRDYREALGKVPPAKVKPIKPPARVPPRQRPLEQNGNATNEPPLHLAVQPSNEPPFTGTPSEHNENER